MSAATGSATQTPRGAHTLGVVALLAGTYFAFAPALDGELQFDDLRSIADNPALRDPSRLSRLGANDFLGAGRWLTELTFSLNYRAAALEVRPYHLLNLAAHLLVVLLVLALALLLLHRARWPFPFATAWLTAACFAMHPLQSQAVAYVSQRAEVLGALFYLLGLWLALEAEARRGPTSVAAFAGALFCVFVGWGAKPTLATFPAALILCGAAFPAAPWRRRLLTSLPFWAISALFSARLLAGSRGTAHAGFDIPQLPADSYILTEARVILTYLRLLFWPTGQNVDWDFPSSASALEPRTALALFVIAAILVGAAWLWGWSARAASSELRTLARLASFGLFWFFVILAPTSSVVPVADVIAEHRVYLASFGIFLAAAAAAVLAARRFAREPKPLLAATAAALAVCVALGVALHRRARVWESAISLWSDAAAKSPHKARPHMNLGYALTPVDPARAVEEYRIALALATDGTIRRDELKQDLAGALLSLHRYDEGIAILKELIATSPATPQLETNLAIAYLESGKLEQAQAAAARVAATFPDYAPARHTLGQLAFARGDYAEAKRHFAQALVLDPDSTVSLSSLALTEERLGDRAAACRSWAKYARIATGPSVAAAETRLASLRCQVDHQD